MRAALQRVLFAAGTAAAAPARNVAVGVPQGRYSALWNSPWPQACSKVPAPLPDWDQWRITTNKGGVWNGNAVTLFYTLGLMPRFTGMGPGGACTDGDWNCTAATAVNGGLPQLANMSAHLKALQSDVERALPDKNASGVFAIDWEDWKPSWAPNAYNEFW